MEICVLLAWELNDYDGVLRVLSVGADSKRGRTPTLEPLSFHPAKSGVLGRRI